VHTVDNTKRDLVVTGGRGVGSGSMWIRKVDFPAALGDIHRPESAPQTLAELDKLAELITPTVAAEPA
jgi:hypothetical protein